MAASGPAGKRSIDCTQSGAAVRRSCKVKDEQKFVASEVEAIVGPEDLKSQRRNKKREERQRRRRGGTEVSML